MLKIKSIHEKTAACSNTPGKDRLAINLSLPDATHHHELIMELNTKKGSQKDKI
jgi:hypothetical protein